MSVYGISGLFRQRFDGITPFGGYFFKAVNQLDGALVDKWGLSRIFGEIEEDRISFNKRYEGKEDDIQYSFQQKEKDGLWLGEWKARFASGLIDRGRVVCKIHLDWEGFRQGTIDGWAHNLLEDMVEAGMLRKIEDPKTGEEFIEPV